MASIVCGMTASSAATTSTTISVTCAPRARIEVKAAWPGVIEEGQHGTAFGFHLVGADMLRDPAGFAGNDIRLPDPVEKRGLSPWSTWPMMVMTGGRALRSSSLSSTVSITSSTSESETRWMRMAEFLDDEFRRVGVDGLVLRDHHAVVHQRLDHVGHAFGHAVGKLGHE